MAYTWITPKTDWTASTYFTYTDYNRIRNNLLYINDRLNQMFPEKAVILDLGNPKTGYADNYYPSEFNAFEYALVSFTRVGENVNVGEKKVYKPNSPFILYYDLNRIESCCLRWKNYEPVAESASISPEHIAIGIGETQQLTVTVIPSNAQYTITWASDNTSAATVDSNGLVTGVGEGTYTITATVKSGDKTFVLKASGRIESEKVGTTFYFNGQKYYYDFVYHGWTRNGSSIGGLCLLLPKYRTSALSAKWGNTIPDPYVWNDNTSEYHKVVADFMESNFSQNLLDNLYVYDSLFLSYDGNEVYYAEGKTQNNYLPTTTVYSLESPANADPYVINVVWSFKYKSEYTDEEINGVPLINGTDKGQLIAVRLKNGNNYTIARLLGKQVYSASLDEVLPIRPVFGASEDIVLSQTPNSDGVYTIDWSKTHYTYRPQAGDKVLGDMPFGTIIRDDSGIR